MEFVDSAIRNNLLTTTDETDLNPVKKLAKKSSSKKH